MSNRRRPRSNTTEHRLIRNIDALADFDDFNSDILPILRKAMKEGWTAKQMESDPRVQAALVARQLSIALQEKDAGKSLAAIKDLRDRLEGKAKESKELKLSYEQLSDQELDAKLASLEEIESDELN
jgi:hypothetical protein